MSTPNGQKVQIMLEELHETYGTEWTHSLLYVRSPLLLLLEALSSSTCATRLTFSIATS